MISKIKNLRAAEQAAAEEVTAKETALVTAKEAVEIAATAHSEDDATSERAWLNAKEHEAFAQLRVNTAKRKHVAAIAEREAAEKVELNRELAELRAALDRPDAEEARLVRKEAGLLVAIANVRVARRANLASRLQLKRRLDEVTRLLTGEVRETVYRQDFDTSPSFAPVAEELGGEVSSALRHGGVTHAWHVLDGCLQSGIVRRTDQVQAADDGPEAA